MTEAKQTLGKHMAPNHSKVRPAPTSAVRPAAPCTWVTAALCLGTVPPVSPGGGRTVALSDLPGFRCGPTRVYLCCF